MAHVLGPSGRPPACGVVVPSSREWPARMPQSRGFRMADRSVLSHLLTRSTVLSTTTEKQVIGAYALRGITMMEHIKALRNRPSIKLPGKPITTDLVPGLLELAVFLFLFRTGPEPTARHRLHADLLFVSFLDGFAFHDILLCGELRVGHPEGTAPGFLSFPLLPAAPLKRRRPLRIGSLAA